MQKSNEKTDTPYVLKLDSQHRHRYLAKLGEVNGFDPYDKEQDKLKKHVWSKDVQLIPPVAYGDLFNYLVSGTSYYSFDQFKNYKSLEAHVQFTNGWVQDVEIHKPENCDNFVLRSKVLHSQRLNEKMLHPWVIVGANGTVQSAHCTCMAGLAETCTHVAALLFKVEAIVRVRERTTVTGEAAYWMIPGSINKVEPKAGYEIDLTTAQKRKRQLDTAIETGQCSAAKRTLSSAKCKSTPPTSNELTAFFDGLKTTSAAVLSLLPGHCDKFKDPVDPVIVPRSLTTIRDQSLETLNYNEILTHCTNSKFNSVINLSPEQCKKIERLTQGQHKCPRWYSLKTGRITASNLYSVCVFDINKPSVTTIKNICYPSKLLNVPAVTWGVQNENTAREGYKRMGQNKHVNLKVDRCGLIIDSENSYLGASPDALVCCECCGTGCLEIKCPFKFKDSKIIDAMKDKDFCLAYVNDEIVLKESHPYFYQVQAQMFVTKATYCDFFVWTSVDSITVRIVPNTAFMNLCKEKAKFFFYNVSLPELAAQHFTKDKLIQISCNSDMSNEKNLK